jgi:hypothetical protein
MGAICSVRFRTATGAGVANLGLCTGVIVVPLAAAMAIDSLSHYGSVEGELVALLSPAVVIDLVLQGAMGGRSDYSWHGMQLFGLSAEGMLQTTVATVLIAMAYYLFGWIGPSQLAAGWLRRD